MLAASALVAGLVNGPAVAADPPDPSDPSPLFAQITDGDLRMQLQTTARLDGGDTVFRISGTVMSNVPGNQYAPTFAHGQTLFGFEGYNIRRWYRVPGTNDIQMVSREIVFYTDLKTGEVLTSWVNPFDGKSHAVLPVANDHVNQTRLRMVDGKLFVVFGPQQFPYNYTPGQQFLGRESWTANIAPLYSLAERYGIDEDFGLVDGMYASWELFDTSVDREQVAPWRSTSEIRHDAMPTAINWTRTGPTVPWMCIAENEKDVHLLYSARSWSMSSFDELEPWIKTLVTESYPLYRSAPTEVDPAPNATTWTAFYYDQLAGKGPGGTDLSWARWCDAPRATTTALTSDRSTQVYGAKAKQRVTLTATVASPDGTPAGGSVEFRSGKDVLATVALAAGSATYRLPKSLAAGIWRLSAHYLGGDTHAASSSQPVKVRVQQATSKTKLRLSKFVQRKGKKPAKAHVTVRFSPAAAPAGTVTISVDGSAVATAPVRKNGTLKVAVPRTTRAGVHTVRARYNGTSNLAASTSRPIPLVVVR